MDPELRGSLQVRFDEAATIYAESRPSYPDAAVDWLLEGEGIADMIATDVLDLGAGGGALTRLLTERATGVVAAEPSLGLLRELGIAAPKADRIQARAEQLPVGDDAFDVVTVATAFHWFDHGRALPEIARVLRAGGRLSLVWNTRSLSEPWCQELNRLLVSVRPPGLKGQLGPASVDVVTASPLFEKPERAEFPHRQRVDRAGLIGLAASRSYVIALPPGIRATLLADVGELFDANVGDNGFVEMPYLAECWRAVRVG